MKRYAWMLLLLCSGCTVTGSFTIESDIDPHTKIKSGLQWEKTYEQQSQVLDTSM